MVSRGEIVRHVDYISTFVPLRLVLSTGCPNSLCSHHTLVLAASLIFFMN